MAESERAREVKGLTRAARAAWQAAARAAWETAARAAWQATAVTLAAATTSASASARHFSRRFEVGFCL